MNNEEHTKKNMKTFHCKNIQTTETDVVPKLNAMYKIPIWLEQETAEITKKNFFFSYLVTVTVIVYNKQQQKNNNNSNIRRRKKNIVEVIILNLTPTQLHKFPIFSF